MDSNSRVGASSSTTRMCSLMTLIYSIRHRKRKLNASDSSDHVSCRQAKPASHAAALADNKTPTPSDDSRSQAGYGPRRAISRRRTGGERTPVRLVLVDDQLLHPITRLGFSDPKRFAHAHQRRVGFPFLRLIFVDHIFLSVPVEQVDDVAVTDRESEIGVEPARLG